MSPRDLEVAAEKFEMEEDEATHVENADVDARINALTPEEQKKTIRQIDRRLVITLGVMFSVSLLDRNNLGVAIVAGMGVDLKLAGTRYSLVILTFFVSYVLLQPIATVVLRKVGPRIFLPTIAILWGCTMLSFGFVRDWTQLIPLRIILGIFEAGTFPGSAYLLSCWYPRYELQKRNSVFYLIGSTIASLGGILGYGFSQMNGLGGSGNGYSLHNSPTSPSTEGSGIAGWRWIFIMEGIITCAMGAVTWFLVVDFPEQATKTFGLKFLTQKQADFAVARIEKDRNDVALEPFNLQAYVKGALDLKIWGFAAIFGLSSIVTFGISYFMPIILRQGLGFGVAASQCLSAPPNVAAAIVMYGFAIIGDKYHLRSPFLIFDGILSIAGFATLGFATNPNARYLGIFLASIGANVNIPVLLTWQANNIRGQWKRAVCSAILISHGGLGAIVASLVFRDGDKPKYLPGVMASIIAMGLTIVITITLVVKFHRANRRAEAGGKVIEGLPDFRYTL